ncbi:hypothetical protein ACFQFH_10705 [Halobaculum halobium]|uniref:Uncharacterized protein n=1 Tax=Halobaculum halobium TaxID=3032281 RepID=A0ABD5TCR4_9EURY|nr:hypothetical protein [Halobaculum sp. SYNS20]
MRRIPSGDGERADREDPPARLLLAVAVVFTVLGGALVRFATVESPPDVVWTAMAVVVVAAAVALFGGDAVRAAVRVLGR